MTVLSLRDDTSGHASPGHPERPARLAAVRQRLAATPALASLPMIRGEPAPREALERVHPAEYLDGLEALCESGGGAIDPDTYVKAGSWSVVRETAGDLLAVVDRVLSLSCKNGFAIGRPPGHHVGPERVMGFGLLSNVAVAARHAQAVHGVERVMVVDIDVHHGNGTQDLLQHEDRALFVSSHQFPHWPGTGRADETGPLGNILNLPIPPGTAGPAFREAWETHVFPRVAAFRPELILISAGFDAHADDPLSDLNLTEEDFTWITHRICDLADTHAGGRVVSVLEGGYNLDSLAASTAAHIRVLMERGA